MNVLSYMATKKSKATNQEVKSTDDRDYMIDEEIKRLFAGEQVLNKAEFVDSWKAMTHLEKSLELMAYKSKRILRDELETRSNQHLKKRALELAKSNIKQLKSY